jgi:hypothetical protein
MRVEQDSVGIWETHVTWYRGSRPKEAPAASQSIWRAQFYLATYYQKGTSLSSGILGEAQGGWSVVPGLADVMPTVLESGVGEKKRGPRLGSGAPEGAFRSQRRFHTGCVGSSILASLSEAGGNEQSVVTSKPLPPRFVTLRPSIHSKRAHG